MGKVVKLESIPKVQTLDVVNSSPLTPKLKEFIDRVIVPILVKQFLAESDGADVLAENGGNVARSVTSTAIALRGQRP